MLTRRTTLAAALALSALGTLPAFAADITIKFSHVVAPDTPKGKAANKFKELAEAYTNGKVAVEIYPNSQLYKDKEEMEALQLGSVQMLAPSLAKFGPLGVPAFEVFDLPYIFDNYDALHRVTEGTTGKDLLDRLDAKGIKGLAYWDNGFKLMSANTPLREPADMLGLKMRIQSSKVLEAEMNALGAVPQVMAFSEVYQGLQTGVVDGTENPPSNMSTQKMNEVQKYAALTNHGYIGYALIVNKAFWDGLPQDVRSELDRAVTEATDYANSIAKEENDRAMQSMKDAGTTEFHELTPDELQHWKTTLMPVWDKVRDRIGGDVIDAVSNAAKG